MKSALQLSLLLAVLGTAACASDTSSNGARDSGTDVADEEAATLDAAEDGGSCLPTGATTCDSGQQCCGGSCPCVTVGGKPPTCFCE